MEQLDLNKVRVFICVVESGSLTRAATLLKQPKSRISRHLADLESDLNTPLLLRTTRKMQLTNEGRVFFEKVGLHVKELDALAQQFVGSAEKVEGRIKITAPVDLGSWCLPKILDEFMRLHPAVEFEVLLSQQVVDLVEEGVDIAMRVAKLKDSALKATKVVDLKSIVVASPSYLQRYDEIRQPEQMLSHACLDFNLANKGAWWLFKGNEKIVLKVKSRFSANDPQMLLSLAKQGYGVALLPEFLCREDLSSGRLHRVLKSWEGSEVALSVVTPPRKEVPFRVKAFREFLLRQLRQQLD